jgi:hypothetical protein
MFVITQSGVKGVIANDFSVDAVEAIRRNVVFNELDPQCDVLPNHRDAWHVAVFYDCCDGAVRCCMRAEMLTSAFMWLILTLTDRPCLSSTVQCRLWWREVGLLLCYCG